MTKWWLPSALASSNPIPKVILMTEAPDEAALLVAELLARRWLPRLHPRVRRALIDADLWQSVQDRLAQIGLRLIDNIHADHVCVALLRGAESVVFGEMSLD